MISSGQTVIRPGEVQDAESIAELHAHSWRTTYRGIVPEEALGDGMVAQRRELWKLRLDADYGEPENTPRLLIAERAGETVGFVYLVPQPDGRVLVDNLHVRPGLTGGGIGRDLLAAARAHVAERHPGAELFLEVLRDNTRAIAFYEREGAVRVRAQEGVFPGGFVLPEYVYAWPGRTEQ
ncbi:acetyltransferase (GNAT) family protein [Streptomyces sp. 1114.5]|uniref:GNAT family N-acetyltransferase n=1 Tax=unclassified Streptomyces TaxID=2593676 RepID=UPI000BC43A28|nr:MULTISPECIES: GNAT family N-acetyltransferase [unclassified Streptomyces]RKT17158.1 acetyltransferase (GNAT) family protein [Streptomyces sp. 1114.5]SOB83367.1 Acetyltransferase (GNAT) family protein [Streptomyces sp. 1331.2]